MRRMAGYKAAAGRAIDTLNAVPPTLAPHEEGARRRRGSARPSTQAAGPFSAMLLKTESTGRGTPGPLNMPMPSSSGVLASIPSYQSG